MAALDLADPRFVVEPYPPFAAARAIGSAAVAGGGGSRGSAAPNPTAPEFDLIADFAECASGAPAELVRPRADVERDQHELATRSILLPDVAIFLAMLVGEQMPLAEVKNRLSEVVDRLEREHGRVVITKHGRAAAIILSIEDLESLEETLDVIGSRPPPPGGHPRGVDRDRDRPGDGAEQG